MPKLLLCAVSIGTFNRPYRPDVNFKIAALAATGAESDGGDENVTAGVLNGVALDLSTVVAGSKSRLMAGLFIHYMAATNVHSIDHTN